MSCCALFHFACYRFVIATLECFRALLTVRVPSTSLRAGSDPDPHNQIHAHAKPQTLSDGSQPGPQQLPYLRAFDLAAYGIHHDKVDLAAAAAKSYPIGNVDFSRDCFG